MGQRFRLAALAALTVGSLCGPAPSADELKVGPRPYEMEWAGRAEDDVPASVDFEDLAGWTVIAPGSEASFARTREQQIWGRYVGRLVYRLTGVEKGARPVITIRPPKPVAVPGPVDCVRVWVYGNNWAWVNDPTTPRVDVEVLLRPAGDGGEGQGGAKELAVPMGQVNWKEWWLMHHRLSGAQTALLERGAEFTGIRVTGGTNPADRTLYFDNLALYAEKLAPLSFPPRRRRGVEPLAGQSVGLNTGPGRLPFPTRDQTILPDNLAGDGRTSLRQDGNAFVLEYAGPDGTLRYRYTPAGRGLGDLRAQWDSRVPFGLLVGAGLRFAAEGDAGRAGPCLDPNRVESLDCRRDGDTVVARFAMHLGRRTERATCTLRLWGKSLVMDVACPGGQVGELTLGRAVGCPSARLITLPYLVGDGARPAVLVMGEADRPLFLSGLVDHTRSNASALTFANRVDASGVTFNGGSLYRPKTDGRRNDCFERVFLTVSPRLEEVLPNIPNPPSPWMHVAGGCLWHAHGASDRSGDYQTWADIARYGMTHVVITDHETGWRDGGESFTFRTRAAPGKGGDAGQADYARKLHELGFRYGIYNNYTDFAPVNEFWNADMVTRRPDGNWQTAWARCYNPKPARAVEYEARLAPVIQGKFHLSTAYCDVHTAVSPWNYVDYDARVPGAGTLAQTFYCYGEIMLHQKETWGGPVYSEGGNHWYYCGLTDGNYGQDHGAGLAQGAAWLVDFDLRKMHPLCCNFGMGDLGMFFGHDSLGATPPQRDRSLDRFLAATVAFGHTGYLLRQGGIRNTVRSYYLLQQLAAAYAERRVADIRYARADGQLLDTSAAVAAGVHRRNQLKITYDGGLEVWVNGHATESWRTPSCELPPDSFYARGAEGRLVVCGAAAAGSPDRRSDYADTPAYLYADARGTLTCFDKAMTDQGLVALRRQDGKVELIPVGDPRVLAVDLGGRAASAVALDKARAEIGPVEARLSRGMVHVMPKAGVFSYLLSPAAPAAETLACARRQIVPGETVAVRVAGRAAEPFAAPAAAPIGQLLWHKAGDAWIDFIAVPLAEADLTVAGGKACLHLRSNLPGEEQFSITLFDRVTSLPLRVGKDTEHYVHLPDLADGAATQADLNLTAGKLAMRRSWRLAATRGLISLAAVPTDFQPGQRFRKHPEGPLTEGSIATRRSGMICGGVAKDGLFMHPPWKGGVGYTCAVLEAVALPASPPAAFRCSVGKEDGSDSGDGILFRLAVLDEKGDETVLAEKTWIQHAWTDLAGDLSRWAGQRVRLKLIADVGPSNNSGGDWACWADLRIESREPQRTITVTPLAGREASGGQ